MYKASREIDQKIEKYNDFYESLTREIRYDKNVDLAGISKLFGDWKKIDTNGSYQALLDFSRQYGHKVDFLSENLKLY